MSWYLERPEWWRTDQSRASATRRTTPRTTATGPSFASSAATIWHVPVTAVVGGHWGDEGKGKVINLLARDADLVIRGHGGANAGHTVVNEQGRFAVHLVPAGIFNPRALCIIGPGVAVHPGLLVAELDELGAREIDTSGLRVSTAAHLVMPYHQSLDQAEDEAREEHRLGTTGRGIGPTYVDKSRRIGLRVGDLLDPAGVPRASCSSCSIASTTSWPPSASQRPDADAIADEYLGYAERLKPYIAETQPLVDEAVGARSPGRARRRARDAARPRPRHLPVRHQQRVHRGRAAARLGRRAASADARHRRVQGVLQSRRRRPISDRAVRRDRRPHPRDRPRVRHDDRSAAAHRLVRRRRGPPFVAGQRVRRHRADPARPARPGFGELQVCTAYELDGEQIDYFPSQVDDARRAADRSTRSFAGWDEPLTGARGWHDLPANAQAYVRRLEVLLEAPVQLIGVGEAREEIVQL